MGDQAPLPVASALRALIRCVGTTAVLLARRRVHLPSARVGLRLRFEDGTSARVYRETVVDRAGVEDPCVLVVAFRLRAVRGRGHAVFRWESLFNTPLFVGSGMDEAVQVANDTEYGLAAAVFGADSTRALQVALRIQAGHVHVNGSTVQNEAQAPYGGMKSSGYGRFDGRSVINEFTELKWVTVEPSDQPYPF